MTLFLRVVLSLFIVFSILILKSVSISPTLQLVNILYRHGDRSPSTTFPTDEHKEDSWPQGWGWLSKIGIEQHFNLGKFLRQRYNGFLNETYLRNEIKVESSSTDRCLMSAQANLAGLYPTPEELWNKNIRCIPIPVLTRSKTEDNMLSFSRICPKYSKLYTQNLRNHEQKPEEIKNKEFYDFIYKMTKLKPEGLRKIWTVADVLFCEKAHNYTLPNWVNETIFERLQKIRAYSFVLMFGTEEMAKLKGGPLLKQMIENMELKKSGTLSTRFFMYSGHDTTLAALMHSLNIFNHISPPYTACLIMELHRKIDGEYFVRLLYKNSTTDLYNYMEDPYLLTIPGCTTNCPYTKFLELTHNSIPLDWAKDCHLTEGEPKTDKISSNMLISEYLNVDNGHCTRQVTEPIPAPTCSCNC